MPDLLVVIDDIPEVVAAAVVSFAHAHAIVGEVDIAIVAEELRHRVVRCARSWKLQSWFAYRGRCCEEYTVYTPEAWSLRTTKVTCMRVALVLRFASPTKSQRCAFELHVVNVKVKQL